MGLGEGRREEGEKSLNQTQNCPNHPKSPRKREIGKWRKDEGK
jgi:hypothetical protein